MPLKKGRNKVRPRFTLSVVQTIVKLLETVRSPENRTQRPLVQLANIAKRHDLTLVRLGTTKREYEKLRCRAYLNLARYHLALARDPNNTMHHAKEVRVYVRKAGRTLRSVGTNARELNFLLARANLFAIQKAVRTALGPPLQTPPWRLNIYLGHGYRPNQPLYAIANATYQEAMDYLLKAAQADLLRVDELERLARNSTFRPRLLPKTAKETIKAATRRARVKEFGNDFEYWCTRSSATSSVEELHEIAQNMASAGITFADLGYTDGQRQEKEQAGFRRLVEQCLEGAKRELELAIGVVYQTHSESEKHAMIARDLQHLVKTVGRARAALALISPVDMAWDTPVRTALDALLAQATETAVLRTAHTRAADSSIHRAARYLREIEQSLEASPGEQSSRWKSHYLQRLHEAGNSLYEAKMALKNRCLLETDVEPRMSQVPTHRKKIEELHMLVEAIPNPLPTS